MNTADRPAILTGLQKVRLTRRFCIKAILLTELLRYQEPFPFCSFSFLFR